jgi:hypothetical protein
LVKKLAGIINDWMLAIDPLPMSTMNLSPLPSSITHEAAA